MVSIILLRHRNFFTASPIMFVAHNFSGADAYEQAFFTNALMGLKAGASVRKMNAPKQFESECSRFLQSIRRRENPFHEKCARRVLTQELLNYALPSAEGPDRVEGVYGLRHLSSEPFEVFRTRSTWIAASGFIARARSIASDCVGSTALARFAPPLRTA